MLQSDANGLLATVDMAEQRKLSEKSRIKEGLLSKRRLVFFWVFLALPFFAKLSVGNDKEAAVKRLSSSGLNVDLHYGNFWQSVSLAGKGRFLAFAGKQRSHFLFDFSTLRIIEMQIKEPFLDERVAGTATKVFFLSKLLGRISRYDLKTFNHELTIEHRDFGKGMCVDILAGAYGNGPLGLIVKNDNKYWLQLFDTGTLERIPNFQPQEVSLDCQVSPDGRVFSCVLGSKIHIYDLEHLTESSTNEATSKLLPFISPIGYLPTNFNGSIVFSQFGPMSRQGVPLYSEGRFPRIDGLVIPASHSNLFVVVRKSPRLSVTQPIGHASFYSVGDTRPIGIMNDVPLEVQTHGRIDDPLSDFMPSYQRIWFVPEHEVLAILNPNNLHIRRFSINEELRKRDTDFLFVDSIGPPNAYAGSTFRHAISIVASKTPCTLELRDAPAGAFLEKNVFRWDVPKDVEHKEVIVRIDVLDAMGTNIEYPIPIQVVQRLPESNSSGETNVEGTAILDSREWKDPNGKVLGRGRFVRIIDKKSILVELDSGASIEYQLKQLCLGDIRYALESSQASENSK